MSIQALSPNNNSLNLSSTDRAVAQVVVANSNVTSTETSNPVNRSSEVTRNFGKPQVSEAVDAINKVIRGSSQNLEFTVDDAEGNIVVKVVDQQTKEVLRQIPSEEALEIAKSLDKLQGLLIRQVA
ncbi:MAG: flagellar protein FlaG [Burkholderiaceae bacterium]|nr:MAG: flagellar protein FlaG [Burkholderiaceae bacterium]